MYACVCTCRRHEGQAAALCPRLQAYLYIYVSISVYLCMYGSSRTKSTPAGVGIFRDGACASSTRRRQRSCCGAPAVGFAGGGAGGAGRGLGLGGASGAGGGECGGCASPCGSAADAVCLGMDGDCGADDSTPVIKAQDAHQWLVRLRARALLGCASSTYWRRAREHAGPPQCSNRLTAHTLLLAEYHAAAGCQQTREQQRLPVDRHVFPSGPSRWAGNQGGREQSRTPQSDPAGFIQLVFIFKLFCSTRMVEVRR